MKRKKLIITESQYNRVIKPLISESDYHVILDRVIEDLNKNYESVTAVIKDYHDYNEQPRIKVKVDDSIINAKDLLEYFKYKYHGVCGENFLKQVIDDWYHGRVKDGMLSKNITLK
jgi:hypothetical protein